MENASLRCTSELGNAAGEIDVIVDRLEEIVPQLRLQEMPAGSTA